MAKPLKVGLACNIKASSPLDPGSGPPDADAEFDDLDTVHAIQDALSAGGHQVSIYEATADLPLMLINDRPDIVFNIAEGVNGRGREAHVPAILSFLGIPFTGSDETTMCITIDKALTKRLLATYGVLSPNSQLVTSPDQAIDQALTYPLIVKPNAEGSSKGISDLSVANSFGELRQIIHEKIDTYRQALLVEEYIAGREFTVGILGNGDQLRVFTPMEVIFTDQDHQIYSYQVKRNFQRYIEYKSPPDIDPGLMGKMMDTAEKVFRTLECRDCSRIDFRLSDSGDLYFIEINPLPGLAPGYSDYPMLAGFNGVDYVPLVQAILDSALKRYNMS